jgi:hypothetical protein
MKQIEQKELGKAMRCGFEEAVKWFCQNVPGAASAYDKAARPQLEPELNALEEKLWNAIDKK